MFEPRFWYTPPDHPSLIARLLSPVSALYARAQLAKLHPRRHQNKPYAAAPFLAIDCINTGCTQSGGDLISTMMALVQTVQMMGRSPAVVLTGAGRGLSEPIRVDPASHSAAQVGDEALLLAAFCPVYIGDERLALANAAIAQGADVLIGNETLRSADIAADFRLLVVDAQRGFGNGKSLPAGPLRVSLSAALAQADAVLCIGSHEGQIQFQQNWSHKINCPIWHAEYNILQTGMDWQDLPVLAFAGIARPELFFRLLRQQGARLIRAEALSNHQLMTPALLHRLEASAAFSGAQLVTTEKDAVRLPAEFLRKVLTVPVRLEIKEHGALQSRLRHGFNHKS